MTSVYSVFSAAARIFYRICSDHHLNFKLTGGARSYLGNILVHKSYSYFRQYCNFFVSNRNWINEYSRTYPAAMRNWFIAGKRMTIPSCFIYRSEYVFRLSGRQTYQCKLFNLRKLIL
jgi:hypothetical protein